MKNIDFSRLVTARTKAEQAALAHAEAAKAECKQRILAQFPFAAQQNIAQAVTLYAVDALRGQASAGVAQPSGLSEADIAQATKGQEWIALMQAACRGLADDPEADLLDDAAWPALPDAVALLIAKF